MYTAQGSYSGIETVELVKSSPTHRTKLVNSSIFVELLVNALRKGFTYNKVFQSGIQYQIVSTMHGVIGSAAMQQFAIA